MSIHQCLVHPRIAGPDMVDQYLECYRAMPGSVARSDSIGTQQSHRKREDAFVSIGVLNDGLAFHGIGKPQEGASIREKLPDLVRVSDRFLEGWSRPRQEVLDFLGSTQHGGAPEGEVRSLSAR